MVGLFLRSTVHGGADLQCSPQLSFCIEMCHGVLCMVLGLSVKRIVRAMSYS